METAKRTGARVAGPIPLPTRRALQRQPQPPRRQEIHGRSREIRTHKRLLDIICRTAKTVDEPALNLPAVGVDITIKSEYDYAG